MHIRYDVARLERIIIDFARLTDVKMNFCDSDGRMLTNIRYDDDYCSRLQKDKNNLKRCRRSDAQLLENCKKSKRIVSHICYAGLCDLAMPIIKRDIVVGYLIMGRIQTEKTPFCATDTYDAPPYFCDVKLQSLVEFLPQILFESAIDIEDGDFISDVTEYINNNIADELTVESICAAFHLSKNKLYREFHDGLENTVNGYVLEVRIKRAKHLLRKTSEPVYRIAELVGIPNYSYFCRLFKNRVGVTPGKYRQSRQ